MEEYRAQVLIEQQVDELLEKNGVSRIRCDDIFKINSSLKNLLKLK
jgi:hypothetical protein